MEYIYGIFLPVLLNTTWVGLSFITRSKADKPSLSWIYRLTPCLGKKKKKEEVCVDTYIYMYIF